MRKLIFTFISALMFGGFAIASTPFNLVTFTGDLPAGDSIVTMNGIKYLKIRVNGWNTSLNIAPIVTYGNTTLTFSYKYAQDTSSYTNTGVQAFVQFLNSSWGSKISITDNPASDTFKQIKTTLKADTLAVLQLAVQQTSGSWSAVSGPILYIGQFQFVTPFNMETFQGDVPSGGTIDTINGTPYLKIRLNGWNTDFDIVHLIFGNTNISYTYKYSPDTTATYTNANTEAFIQLMGLTGHNQGIGDYPASDTFKTITKSIVSDTIKQLQLAGFQHVSWNAINGPIMWISKLKISYIGSDIVNGSNMEDSTKWNFYWGTNGSDKGTHKFNYTDSTLKFGSGGSYEVTASGQSASFIWQPVTVIPGHQYYLSGAFRNISVDAVANTWVEFFLTKTKPTGGDVSTGMGYSLNTYAPMNATFKNFNCTFQDSFQHNLMPGKFVVIPDSTTQTTWYVVVKAGDYQSTAGVQHPKFDFLFDNISVVDSGFSPSDFQIAHKIFGITPPDYKGDVNMSWDKDSVYMTYTVADDSIVNTGTAYQVDNIEVYFDMNNSKDIHWPRNGGWLANIDAAYDSTDYQMRLVPGVPFATNNAARPSGASIDTGYDQIYTRTKIGYNFKLNIAWQALKKGFVPASGKLIGFDVNLSDNNAVASDANRNQFTLNSPNPNLFNDPASWGTFKLGDNGRFIQIFDKQAPTVPTALKDTIIGGKAKITWTASTDNIVVQNYKIYVDGTLDTTLLAAKTGNNYTTKKVLALGDHTIDVTAVDLYGNTSAKATVKLTITVGIKESNLEIVKTYPNPVSDILKFSNSLSNKAVANVYSITGQLVLTSSIADGTLNVSSLNSGMYLIRLSDSGSNYVGKFIKK
jgi:hypothetical protein